MKKLASLATGLVFLSLAGSACASQIWVGIEDDSSKIKQYDLDGNYTGFSDLGTATNPISMTQVGSEVWVGIEDYNSKINRYDLDGNFTGFIDLGNGYNNPLAMTYVTQVAEPTTILIFGSSLVGLLSARIRRKKLQKAGVIKPQPCSNSSTR